MIPYLTIAVDYVYISRWPSWAPQAASQIIPPGVRSVAIELAHESDPAHHLRSWRNWWRLLADALCHSQPPRRCFTVFVDPEAATLDKVLRILHASYQSMTVERLAVCPLLETRFSAPIKSWPMF
jgi:hypothetical protein